MRYLSGQCQSCGLYIVKDSDWGTQEDDSKTHDYCLKCYVKGKFTELEISLEQMAARLNEAMKTLGFPKRTIEDDTRVLSNLKRWKEVSVQLPSANLT